MSVHRLRRSQPPRLLFLGAATLLSGCHSSLFVPDQSELYPSSDHAPDTVTHLYRTETECIESLGAEYCEPVEETPTETQPVLAGQSTGALGYDDGENYQALWPSQYPIPQPVTYWVSRGLTTIAGGVVRGGFGRSALRFGGGSLS